MASVEDVGDAAGWLCWLCGEEVPRTAKANDPAQAVGDQVAPAGKGEKGRGTVRLAHKRCNDRRKGRPPSIAWPERFAVADAPELLQSLIRIDKRRPRGGEVIALCVDEQAAQSAASWVVPVAETLFAGRWEASCEPLSRLTAVRLVRLG